MDLSKVPHMGDLGGKNRGQGAKKSGKNAVK
jgi:hypothetical protein